MKKIYIDKLRVHLSILLFLVCTFSVLGQDEFTLRTSSKAPSPHTNEGIYNLRGDFTMIGNSNLYDNNNPNNRDKGNGNNGNMSFYKLSGDGSSISNSSSSTLVKPTGLDLTCTKIVYAGLYWTGRGENSSNDATKLKNGLQKKKIKVKLPGQSNYVEYNADVSNIGNSSQRDIYTSYVDITDKVIALGNNAWGTYSVADIATTIGNGSSTGYFGGWGMVVIYENPKLSWKDITVFDGFSFINGADASSKIKNLTVTGFRAAQSGAISVKLGIIAGEGDADIVNDFLQMKLNTSNSYEKLNHGPNTQNNFFNSTIDIAPNTRVHNNTNNYGVDVFTFKLDNSNNKFIDNNQQSTKFQYGTTGDTYVISTIIFAVDAYVPEVEAFNSITTPGISSGSQVNPGDEVSFELTIKNKGNEKIKDGKVQVVIPPNMHFVSASIDSSLDVKGSVSWSHPQGNNSAALSGGIITWVFDKQLSNADKDAILGKLRYTLRATDNCEILTSSFNNCLLTAGINGKVSGIGLNSNIELDTPFVKGYSESNCFEAEYDSMDLDINLSPAFLSNCATIGQSGAKVFAVACDSSSNEVPRATVEVYYPSGTKFYSIDFSIPNAPAVLVTGDFPASELGIVYYAQLPWSNFGCFLQFKAVSSQISTTPTVQNIDVCLGDNYTLENKVSQVGLQHGLTLFYFGNETDSTPLSQIPHPTNEGVYTYYVAEGRTGCYGEKIAFTVTIKGLPIEQTLESHWQFCENSDGLYKITTSDTVVWEYALAQDPNTWIVLQSNSFNSILQSTSNNLKVSHASQVINGVLVRVRVSNSNGCSSYSAPMKIVVDDCSTISNPALPSKAYK
ncbi:hypothetical protein ACYSNX_03360 [Myroides sp. LJL115]